MQYGLIGEKLGHSFSKIIHEKLADYTYELCPLPRENLHRFMTEKQFCAINVTIPYKQMVMPYCDSLHDSAREIGAVNTVVNRGGRLIGYNTDFAGFLYNLQAHGVVLRGKKVMILGSGGTCKTVAAAARQLGAREIVVVSRTKQPHTVTYGECLAHVDTEVIVNASPKGMYPLNDECPLDLSRFPGCVAAVDVIYNPLKTRFLQQAEQLGIKAVNGLTMLVAQAKFAAEYFLDTQMDEAKIAEITQELLAKLTNIVLIGMPSCGKTLTAKALCGYIDKAFVDTDAVIEQRAGMSIREIFARHGEAYFRELEQEVIAQLAARNTQIIATGGGAVKLEENMRRLKQNGVVIWIDRDLDLLQATDDRPLSGNVDAVRDLYRERYALYRKYADFAVKNNYPLQISQPETEELMRNVLEGYREILCDKWT